MQTNPEFNPASLKPVNAYFLIELRETRETKAGIILSNNFNAMQCQGTIVAIDDNLRSLDWVQPSIKDLKIGDRVQFLPNNKLDVPKIADEAEHLTLVPVQAIIGVYAE